MYRNPDALTNFLFINQVGLEDFGLELYPQNQSFGPDKEGPIPLIVASFKQPYVHWYGPETIECGRPKGAITRAFDQCLRQSGGLWVAHSSGNADQVVSRPNGKVAVPPQNSLYELKRLCLTQKQVKEHYYGFSCGGLWSMCHLVPEGMPLGPEQFLPYEPVFYEKFWRTYQEVNQLFAKNIHDEDLGSSTKIWILDYSLALVPELIRSKNPRVNLNTIWPIPWPRPAFAKRCPWTHQIIKGLLGSDFLHFDSANSIQNFLRTASEIPGVTVDREGWKILFDEHPVNLKVFSLASLTAEKSLSKSNQRERTIG